jgi:Tol biopolymer transport system component
VERPEDAKELPSRLSENEGGSGLSWLNDRQLVISRWTDFPSLWMVNDDGTGQRRLTEGSLSIFPTTSRDGQTIVFASNRDTGAMPELYRLTLADGRVTRLARDVGAVQAKLSPDGRTVFFTRVFESPAKLLKMPVDGGPATPLLEAATIHDFAVSPDGTRIAVVTNAGAGSVRNVAVVPAGGGESRTIYTTGSALNQIRWHPAGDAFLLLINQDRQDNFYRLDLAGGPPRQLTRFARVSVAGAAISPDGRRLAYYRGTHESDIVLLKPRTTE